MLQQDVKQKFQEHLLKNEDILWSGQPDPSIIFTSADIFLIPLSLMWGGFAIFWELSTLLTMSSYATGAIDILFPLFGIPFVIIGLYLIFGRFIYKNWKKRRTYYAVTNQRVLSLSTSSGQQFQELNIESIPGLNKKARTDGRGTLTFDGGQPSLFPGYQFYANTGLDILPLFSSQLGFYDINNVNEVYRIITDIKNKINL